MKIPREITFEVEKHLEEKEITLILGPRQVGKTTLLKYLAEKLKSEGKTVVFFNLDVLEDLQYFQTQHTLLHKIQVQTGKNFVYLFIDEIQRLADAGRFLKGLYDMEQPLKIIVSGSGSLELKAKLKEEMTGRKRIFILLPVSFEEFAVYKAKIPFEKINNYLEIDKYSRERLFNEYIIWGGYPRVILAETNEEKNEVLKEIFASYVEKDVKNLIGIEKDEAYSRMVEFLAAIIGGLVNKSEISKNFQISQATVRRYLDFLEKTYIIKFVRPYFSNLPKQLVKSPKFYFLDLGLRNYALDQFSNFQGRADKGQLFENFIFLSLLEQIKHQRIYFWRTKGGAEIDFVVEKEGRPVPIEVKGSLLRGKELGKSAISFIKSYQPAKLFFYHLGELKKQQYLKTAIFYLPFWAKINDFA